MRTYAEEMIRKTVNEPVEINYSTTNESDKTRKENQILHMIELVEAKYGINFSETEKTNLRKLVFTVSKRSKKELSEEVGSQKIFALLEQIAEDKNVQFSKSIQRGFAYVAAYRLSSEQYSKIYRTKKWIWRYF